MRVNNVQIVKHCKSFLLYYLKFILIDYRKSSYVSFLPLGATAQGELWPPEQSASILLYSSSADCLVSEQFSFLLCEVVSLTPNP
jgi:hypothetical protein